MELASDNLDDLLRDLYQAILQDGSPVQTSRGETREIIGVYLELRNPRARLSRTETRGRPFSAIGEFLWYMSGSNSLDFITPYIPKYKDDSLDGMTVHGGYGPRLFNHRRENQIENIRELLIEKPTTRRAVIQLFDAEDTDPRLKEVPCTTTLQFLIRDGKLDLIATMRSNDAWLGLPHDVFCFTMIQEIFCTELGVELGTYRHFVSSMHFYPDGIKGARRYISEGIQSRIEMPAMPQVSAWPSIRKMLELERQIRNGQDINYVMIGLAPYWLDLLRLVEAHFARGRAGKLNSISKALTHEGYKMFVQTQLRRPPIQSQEPRQGTLQL